MWKQRMIIDEWPALNFSYFSMSRDTVACEITTILAAHIRAGRYQVIDAPLDLKSMSIGHPHIGGSVGPSALVFSPRINPTISIFVSDSQDGWATLVNILSNNMKCD